MSKLNREEPILIEAAGEYAIDSTGFIDMTAYRAFIAGAKWQKAKMMKEAVDAKIYGYDDGSYELIASWLDLPKGIYKDGDKVRVIVIKEDEK